MFLLAIITLLGAATPDQAAFNGSALTYTALVSGIGGTVASVIIGVVTLTRRQPPIHREFVSKAEFEAYTKRADQESVSLRGKLDRDVERIVEKLDERFLELNMQSERRAKETHDRINELASAVARLDERTGHRS